MIFAGRTIGKLMIITEGGRERERDHVDENQTQSMQTGQLLTYGLSLTCFRDGDVCPLVLRSRGLSVFLCMPQFCLEWA